MKEEKKKLVIRVISLTVMTIKNYNDDDQKLPHRPSGNIVTPKHRKKLSKENKFVTPQRQTRKQNKS